MNFWEKVDQEREFKNLTRKELAYKAKFSLNSISTGIARNSIPAADVAVRIAGVLGTTVESLMSQNYEKKYQPDFNSTIQESLYTKYRNFIEDFDKLSPENQKAIIQIVSQITH
ncbi:helix-turn-helix transcriptional regulator [uncultured Treponema sp.]|uniref:helix-turn-helix domain-containing protein n=1 Tax=uncultured Treponema sp. TaxID=162155 RepID=UPI0025D36278|nr:helix-turn-helix transcriptional regulator [uncultured Treponema sp.]